MKPLPLTLVLCVGLSSVFQTWAGLLELHMKPTEDNLYDQLHCSMEKDLSDEKILSMIEITIIDFTHSQYKLKLASASILERDLCLQHTNNIQMKVSGNVSKDSAELDIRFNKESRREMGSFLCELTYINLAGLIDKSHAALKSKLPYDISKDSSDDSELTLLEQISTTANRLVDAMRDMNNTVDQLVIAKTHVKDAMDKTLNKLNDRFTALETESASQMTGLHDQMTGLNNQMIDLNDQMTALLDKCSQNKDTVSEQYYDLMGTGKNEWRLAFRGTAKINKSVFGAYLNGGVNVEPGCKQITATLPCRNHYRKDDVLDKWQNIDEIALVLYEKGLKVKQIIFDAVGTTFMDWFSKDKVKNSSWDDMTPTATYNHFSIEGEGGRRFFINSNYGGCAVDRGWFVASETDRRCHWDSNGIFPLFLYSNGGTKQYWHDPDGVETADVMAVFVKYFTN